ncbi:MAG: cyclic dehypoxanthinyl futalosine synthase [Bacillota bacterium]
MLKLKTALGKVYSGDRLTDREGLLLLEKANLLDLGLAASNMRRRLHPENLVTFVVDRNINYTNVCSCECKFCAFYRRPDDPAAYILPREELGQKIEETVAVGGTQLLIQGGLHPSLGLEYYLDMLRYIKERFAIHIHSFSPPEVVHMARLAGLSIEQVLVRLKDAGLDSLPGGGAEILSDRVRKVISPNKISWREWMEVMQTAHRVGLKTTATMMFGHMETLAERIKHLVRLREAQDQTGGFTAFIPWSFQPGNTALGGRGTTGVDYLRTLAVARLMLDNIPNLQASWVTQGAKMAQVSLAFGANDFGGTMLEENVVRAAGVAYRIPRAEIIRSIREAGFTPARRGTDYKILETFK